MWEVRRGNERDDEGSHVLGGRRGEGMRGMRRVHMSCVGGEGMRGMMRGCMCRMGGEERE